MRIATPGAPAVASDEIAAHGVMYEACDIPPGMTIDEYRRRRATKHRARRLRRLRERLLPE